MGLDNFLPKENRDVSATNDCVVEWSQGHKMTPVSKYGHETFGGTDTRDLMMVSDELAQVFLDAVTKRARHIRDGKGAPAEIDIEQTRYVVPGVLLTVTAGETVLPVWIGLNEHRIYYIQRMLGAPGSQKNAFRFSFGGAMRVGWSFYYESVGVAARDGEDSGVASDELETSVWGTVQTQRKLVCGRGAGKEHELTGAGAFWVNDVVLMVQSALCTIQRRKLAVSKTMPMPM